MATIPGDHIELSLEQSLDHCIKCNICTAACPVSAVTDLFPGPKYVGPQAQRFRKPGQPTPDESVDYCSGCRVCNTVCPTGVRIAELNARARAAIVAEKGLPLRNRLLGRSELLGWLGCGPQAPLANFTLTNPLLRAIIERVMGVARKAPLPLFARYSFRSWYRRRKTKDQRPKTIACTNDSSFVLRLSSNSTDPRLRLDVEPRAQQLAKPAQPAAIRPFRVGVLGRVALGDRASAVEGPDRLADIDQIVGWQLGSQQPLQLRRGGLHILRAMVEDIAIASACGRAPAQAATLLVDRDRQVGPPLAQRPRRRQASHAGTDNRKFHMFSAFFVFHFCARSAKMENRNGKVPY